jgi:predicted RNA-binding Zn-ribbon protein involved in translation (DUF1610 family)
MLRQTSLDTISNKSAFFSHEIGHVCGREFLTIQCSKCGSRHLILAGSRDRTCPMCAREIYAPIYRKYEKILKSCKDLKFVTLTTKPIRRQDPEQIRKMSKWLNRLFHRRLYARSWKAKLATVECKKTPQNEFYYHIHLIIEGSYIPQKQLSKDWKKISGFPIVHIKRIWRTPVKALRYVLKYILKGFNFDEDRDRQDFKDSMKGVRYLRSYGAFYDYNYRTSPHVYFPCPECGAVKSWIILEFCHQVDLIEGVPYDPPD